MRTAPRRNHASRPWPWHLICGALVLLSLAEAYVILELVRYIAIMP
jgi:hypothetical protein